MNTTRTGTLGDEFANLGIALLIGAAGFALLLRLAGTIATWAMGLPQPAGGPEAGLAVLLNPGDPASALSARSSLGRCSPVVRSSPARVLVAYAPVMRVPLCAMGVDRRPATPRETGSTNHTLHLHEIENLH